MRRIRFDLLTHSSNIFGRNRKARTQFNNAASESLEQASIMLPEQFSFGPSACLFVDEPKTVRQPLRHSSEEVYGVFDTDAIQ